ncbi:DUF1542 domain-containing protein, partial [Salmonella enterica subsp. enterica serovar Newport]|nr:DUF1542 domain-containing protein [Salmonella enterica subsp. enterica serovar Newport]
MASSRVHYKMYKKGKALVFCSIATIAIASVVTSIDTSNSYASADEVSLTNNTENSSDNTTTTVPFDQSLLPLNTYNYDQIENLSLSEANQMAASRFFYANFKSWYRSGNDWGDDRSQDIVGSATATFGPSQYSSSPKSGHSFAFNSPDDNSGVQWSANLMPNTNYTLNFGSLGFGISNPNARIVILDASGKTLASMTNLKTGYMDVQNLKFSTGSTPDTNDMYSRITVQILGKFEKQQLNGDISATANTPVISPETKSGTKKYYKVSDYTNQKLSSIIMGKNHDSVYQFEDTANNNSRIVPTYSGYTDQTIDENSISDVSQTFNFTAQSPQKWGVTGGSASYAVVLLNDVKVTNDLENEANKITANINGDSNLTSEEKNQQLAALNLALSNAKTAVSNANTDTEMASAKNDGISNIDAAYKPG